jgi:hypothetical protein
MPHPREGYRTADGTRVPGVTTIVGRWKEAGGLIHWAWQIGRDGGDYRQVRDAAASVGTVIHAMADAHIHGRAAPELPAQFSAEQQAQCRAGYEAFLRWYAATVTSLEWTEQSLVSEQYRYGGTPDAWGRDNQGRGCLYDWKSGAIYGDALVQVGGGYALLCQEHGYDLSGGYHIVRFGKESGDFVHRHYPELDAARRQFLLFREAYEIDRILRHRAR